jgi:hypothetical protein
MVNLAKLNFYSGDTTDKIAVYSLTDDSSGIGKAANMDIPAADSPDSPQVFIASLDNPYGKKCLMTLSWSVDNVNFYPQNTPIYYYNATFAGYYWRALGFGGCSDDKIYFGCTTSYDSAQTIYFQFALDSPT